MALYEGMFLIDNDVVRADWAKAKALVTDTIAKHGGSVQTARRWAERQLAYPIKGKGRATYLLSFFEMSGDAIPPFHRELEIKDEVLRRRRSHRGAQGHSGGGGVGRSARPPDGGEQEDHRRTGAGEVSASYSDKIRLISGTAHPALAEGISQRLDVPLCDAHVGRFPDGEIDIKINDDLRGADCFVLQPLCPPVNENWVELLLLLDCLRRASAGRVTAIMPYYGYARKDRKDEGRVPISAKVVANTISQSGADRVLTIDMHAAQIQGFYDIPVDHLYAKPVLLREIRAMGIESPVVVTPDVGGIKMARSYAQQLGADLAIVDKRRVSGSEIAVEHMIGDVDGRNVIIVDDMISTGGSISEAAKTVRANGALKVVLAVSHAVLCGPAVERLDNCPADTILATDTIPRRGEAPKALRVVSVAGLVARAIKNLHESKSLSVLFDTFEED